MQIASRMAGYSLGEADILRRAMGKKKKEVMAAEHEKFVTGAKRQGVNPAAAEKVFEQMEYFAGYGFNKSHSAAYALVAYRTAWLKAHHPVHFMAALLTTEKGNTDKLVQYVNECREMGIPVLPPDVNASGLDFTVEGLAVRFGLSAIKNAGEAAIQSILEARGRVVRFRSLFHLVGEIDLRLVNKRVLEALVQSGAMDSLGGRRSQLGASLDVAMDYGQKRRNDREARQSSLFGGGDDASDDAAAQAALPDLPDWDERTRLSAEKATLGFYVTGHPLESVKDLLADFASHSSAALKDLESGTEVAVGGIVTDLRKRKSKNGAWWATLHLEDLEGLVEVLVFPKAYESCQTILENDRALLIGGRIEVDEGRVRLRTDEAIPLEELRERRAQAVQVRLEADELEDDLVDRLRATIERHRGEVTLYLEVVRSGRFRVVARAETALKVAPSRALTEALEAMLGPGRLRYRARPAR